MKKKKLNILLSCVGGLFIYDIIDSLRKSNEFDLKIYGMDKDCFAYNKNLCDKFLKCPDVSNEKKFKNFFFNIIKKLNINFFIPFSDTEANFLIKHGVAITRNFPKMKFSFDILNNNNNIFLNKELFYNFCNKNKINTFNYKVISKLNKIKKIKNRKFVLKKSSSSGSRGIFLIDSKVKRPHEILKERDIYISNFNYVKNKIDKSDYILMPYLNGQGYDVDCLSENGKLVKILIRRRMMFNKFMYYSPGHKIINNKVIKKKIIKIIKLCKFSGITTFDIIKSNNSYNVIDMAARPSGSVAIGNLIGFNFITDLLRLSYNLKINRKISVKNKIVQPFLMFKKCYNKIKIDKYIPYYLDQNKI